MIKNTLLIVILLIAFGWIGMKIINKPNKTVKIPDYHEVITTQDSVKYGKYAADLEGNTLYFYSPEPLSETACDYKCLQTWRPYIVDVATSKDFDSSDYFFMDKISVVKRADGLYQYAYDGKLLYKFIGDKKVGDAIGLNVYEKKWKLIVLP